MIVGEDVYNLLKVGVEDKENPMWVTIKNNTYSH